MKVAILGANGFVGTRLVERLVLEGTNDVRLLLRRPAGLARLARFADLDARFADAFDPEALARDLDGCDVLVHAMVGDPEQIVAAARAGAEACRRASVRLVYLSSASVHGQNPPPGTDETSALSNRQPMPYNNAKVRAERALAAVGAPGTAILRPGIVYGPRSQWTEGLRAGLRQGRAFLVEGGAGVCNHIYVDNLIYAVRLCFDHPRVGEGPFYVADEEARTWREFYRPLVEGWGHGMDELWDVPAAGPPVPGLRERVARFKVGPFAGWLLPRVPRRVKDAAKAAVERYSAPDGPSGFALPAPARPAADFEISELHRCRTRLPMDRAARVLGYVPPVPVSEALRRSLTLV